MRRAKQMLRQLAERNYSMAQILWKRDQRKRLQRCEAEPIINYQMGKVGSSTVQASLEARNTGCPVYHVHFLNPIRVAELEDERRKHFGTDRHGYLKRSWLYRFLYEEIQKRDRRWKLVTLVRDPIARNVSTFFENLVVREKPGSESYTVSSDYYGLEIEVAVDNVHPLIELFMDRLAHDRPLRYFDDEVKTVFGIDVFASEFPRPDGYQIISGEQADLLVIRLDDLDRCAARAFSEFLGMDNFELRRTNVGSDKTYATLYKAFKRSFRASADYADRMYGAKFSSHFYDEAEIRAFRNKWTQV